MNRLKFLMILSICFVIGFTVVSLSGGGSNKVEAAISSDIDNNMIMLMESINKTIMTNPKVAISSNPYKYIENDIHFDNIVLLGNKALPVLVQKIKHSDQNGLAEYILAIATEKIAKVNLKKDNWEWRDAKGFVDSWDTHLAKIPHAVNEISGSTKAAAEKINELTDLGTPAIPYILDEIEKGNIDVIPAIEALTDNQLEIGNDVDPVQWAKMNKDSFAELRELTK